MKRLTDRELSKKLGTPRPLTRRQIEVLRAVRTGGTDWEAYARLIEENSSWTIQSKYGPYQLTFLNFKQHLTNAYGRLGVNNRKDALLAAKDLI